MRTWAPQRVMHHQEEAMLNEANPVQNQWYTVFEAEGNIRVYFMTVSVALVTEDLQARLTIDDAVFTGLSISSTFNIIYWVYVDGTGALARGAGNVSIMAANSAFFEGRHVKLEVRKTTNNGNGNLRGLVTWAKL